jgi:hypothetical protein
LSGQSSRWSSKNSSKTLLARATRHSRFLAGGKKRSYAVGDVDGDGLADVIASDSAASAVTVYRQQKGRGLQPGVSQPSFAEIDAVAAGNVDGKPGDEVFVLSEKEGVVGKSVWLTAHSRSQPYSGCRLVSRPRCSHSSNSSSARVLRSSPRMDATTNLNSCQSMVTCRLLRRSSNSGALVKGPDAILALDADQDGRTDLLLLMDKPMSMPQAVEKDGKTSFELRELKDMRFGLAQAANAGNCRPSAMSMATVRRNSSSPIGTSSGALRHAPGANPPGWQVVAQTNASRADAKLVALTVRDTLVAADRENATLAVFGKDTAGKWLQSRRAPSDWVQVRPQCAPETSSGGTSEETCCSSATMDSRLRASTVDDSRSKKSRIFAPIACSKSIMKSSRATSTATGSSTW